MPSLTQREFAYVRITGQGTHESVTASLGLQPSEAWNSGDLNPKTGRQRAFMSWKLLSGLDDTRSLADHISSLLLVVGRKARELRELWVDHDLTLQCVGYYPSGSGMHFDRETVRQVAQLGFAIDCDHYFVDNHDHGN
jgi:hypothetical protein